MITKVPVQKYRFLMGGGTAGSLIREKDWSKTSIGSIDNWPPSLCTALNILLQSPFPMLLFWDTAHYFFYNDAYKSICAGYPLSAPGSPGKQAWNDNWGIIEPAISGVLAGAESFHLPDQSILLHNQAIHLSLNGGPLYNEAGEIAGVLVACTDGTQPVTVGLKQRGVAPDFRSIVIESPVPMIVFSGHDFIIETANDAGLCFWGKDSRIMGTAITESLPELAGQQQLLRDVYETGIPYESKEAAFVLVKNGKNETVQVNLAYTPLKDESGQITGVLVTAYDTSAALHAENELKVLEERIRLAIDVNQVGIYDLNILTGEVVFSDTMHQLYGFDHPIPKDFYVSMIHPDDLEHRQRAHDEALQTGKLEYQYRIILTDGSIRWIDSHAKIYYNAEGVPYRRIGTIQNITEQKAAG